MKGEMNDMFNQFIRYANRIDCLPSPCDCDNHPGVVHVDGVPPRFCCCCANNRTVNIYVTNITTKGM